VPYSRILAPLVAPGIAVGAMAIAVAALVWSLQGKIGNTELVALAVLSGMVVYGIGIAVLARDLLKFVVKLPHLMRAPAAAPQPTPVHGAGS
jgi:hypothetical protein